MKLNVTHLKTATLILLIIPVIQIFYVYIFPRMIALPDRVPAIEYLFNKKTGLKLEIQKLYLKTYWDFSFSLQAEKLGIYDTDNTCVCNTDYPFIKIQPSQLILKKLKIKEIKAKNILVNLTRFKDKTFGAEGFSFKTSELPLEIETTGANIQIDGYKFLINDFYFNKYISLSGNTFDIKPLTRRLSNLTTDGKLDINGKIATFDLNIISRFLLKNEFDFQDYSAVGQIVNLDLSAISPYLDSFYHLKKAKGIINVSFNSALNNRHSKVAEVNVTIKNLSVNEGDFEHLISAPSDTTISLRASAEGKKLTIEKLNLQTNGIILHAKGDISDYNKEKPFFNLAVLLAPSKAENILNLLPYGICKEINLVKKYGISGDVTGAVKLIGKMPEIKLFGNVEAQNVHALRGWENSHTGKIALKFEDLAVNTYVFLKTKNNQTFTLTGQGFMYDKDWNKFDIKTSENLELDLVRAILVPVSEIFDFPIGPVPMIAIKNGTGSANLKIKGFKKDANLNGFVKINNANGSFSGIDANLSKVNLLLNFVNDKILFNTKSLNINGYPSYINGNSDIKGHLILNIGTDNINANVLKNIINKSSLLAEVNEAIEFLNKVSGNIKAKVTLSGMIDEDTDVTDVFQSLSVKGHVILNKNTAVFRDFDMPVFANSGQINFSDKSADAKNLKLKYGSSELTANIKSYLSKDKKNPITEIELFGNNANLNDTLFFISHSEIAHSLGVKYNKIPDFKTKHNLKFSCKFIKDILDFKSINASIQILPSQIKNRKIYVSSGILNIKNNIASINNLSLKIDETKLNLSGLIRNINSQKPTFDLSVKGNDIAVKAITDSAGILPENIKKSLQSCKDYTGIINMNINFSENGATGFLTLKNLSFRHIKSDIPFSFAELPIKFTHNKIFFNHINGFMGRTGKLPIFINLNIENYTKVPFVKGSVAIKTNPIFVERYINTKLLHPIKISGDIGISTDVNGSFDSLKVTPVIKINKESDISYLSANLGDTDILREIKGNLTIRAKNLIINKIEYIKYPIAQNGKSYAMPMWAIKGNLQKNNNDFSPEYITFNTYHNLPAKLLNFIFKKSFIKNGEFNCNLLYKNSGKKPKVIGNLDIYNAIVPLYNLSISTGKIIANENLIEINATGNIMDTNYDIQSELANSISNPIRIKDLKFKTKHLNLERLINMLNKWSIDAYINTALKSKVNFDISDVIVEKGTISAKNITFKTCPIEDFIADFSLDKNSVLKIKANKFKMTGGVVDGNIKYNFKNGATESHLTSRGIDSNSAAFSFFGLQNQITGKLDGDINITTIGLDDSERLKNLNGKAKFHVLSGNMPKLGSLEYLLRATNLIQSGLTTLSVNGLIELLKPFKQGSFSNIKGNFDVHNGTIKNIAIYSQGTHMSLFVNGEYDIAEDNAKIVVFGKLGKKIEGLFGAVGNISANTLLNIIPWSKDTTDYEKEISKIPDIEYKDNDARVFKATVDGNINENNAASSFKWIK